MVVNRQTSWRTDEQLLGMLDEAADWTIRGKAGRTLGSADSLRQAIKEGRRLGHQMTALVRLSGDSVIVFFGQLERLVALIGG